MGRIMQGAGLDVAGEKNNAAAQHKADDGGHEAVLLGDGVVERLSGHFGFSLRPDR